MSDIAGSKSELRAAALAARDAMPPRERAAAAETLAHNFSLPIPAGAIVSGFMPIGSEINPIPLMKRLEEHGARLALPVVIGRGTPLEMRAWSFGAPLVESGWKIKVPPPGAPLLDPDILLVPLACFDRFGHRIGYGAGYYDMTIAGLRARKKIVTVGVAFAVQEIAAVPATPSDERLDYVITERETIKIAPAELGA